MRGRENHWPSLWELRKVSLIKYSEQRDVGNLTKLGKALALLHTPDKHFGHCSQWGVLKRF